MEASLIVTTYNWPEALEATLRSALHQTRLPYEIIVGDDGSDSKTAQVIEEVLRLAKVKWLHVRHGDHGIRQARIKNLAAKYSDAPYLIFVDHDVLLHPEFVADHIANAREGAFLQGKRCFLPEDYTARLLAQRTLNRPSPFVRGLKNRKNAIRHRLLGRMLSWPKGFQKTLRGCNLSMHRETFLKVDGYDETFDQLWGREDSDICYRLFHNKIRVRNLWFQALQYHLHHRVIRRNREDRLDIELRQVLSEKRKKAVKGFSSLSDEGEVISTS